MALFQIFEPGETPLPHARKRAIGIDLGTTNSLVATVRNGLAVVLPDEEGRPLVPSIVRYRDAGVHVETVRYYERRGLLRRPRTPLRGVRHYDEETLASLRFIKRAQSVWLALAFG